MSACPRCADKRCGGCEGLTHGFGGGAYVFKGNGEFCPTLWCTCEKSFWAFTWEDAGAELDEHLEQAPLTAELG